MGGTGPDCVLIHGFVSDRLSWAANAAALMTVARVHALDLPCHGNASVEINSYLINDLVKYVDSSLKENGIAKTHLIGHSLGGAIANAIATNCPETVASLSLIAPLGFGQGIDLGFLQNLVTSTEIEPTLALLRRLVVKPQLINNLVAKHLIDHLSKLGVREGLLKIIASISQDINPQTKPANISTQIIWGAADKINPLPLLTNEILMIENCGHIPHIENAEQVNQLLVGFIQRANCQN